MSPEELNRKMEFIVEQQAQFASDMNQLREAQAETAQITARTSQTLAETNQTLAQTILIVGETGEIVTRLARITVEGFKEVNAKIDALIDAQMRTEEKLNRTDEQLNRTDEHQRRTDESLRKFIESLDRNRDRNRNGE